MRICPSCKEGCLDSFQACPVCALSMQGLPTISGPELGGMHVEGKYALDQMIKEGGMGWIFRGRHLALSQTVAIKLMKPSASDLGGSRIKRFTREAQAVSMLSHPHVISISDFGQTRGGLLYIISEFIDGITLSDLLARERTLPYPRVLRLMAQIMAAVEAAHEKRIIHRDLKPENIMVMQLRSGDDFIKLLDFGIAKVSQDIPSRLTRVGEVCGTPSYMAPEQIRGQPPSVQTDIYALGVLIFELLTGRLPFEGRTVEETLSMHLYEEAPSLIASAPQPGIPEAMDVICRRAMAKETEQRFASVAEMRAAIFAQVSRKERTELPCLACHRPPDSPLGFCSEHCLQPYAEVVFEDDSGRGLIPEPGLLAMSNGQAPWPSILPSNPNLVFSPLKLAELHQQPTVDIPVLSFRPPRDIATDQTQVSPIHRLAPGLLTETDLPARQAPLAEVVRFLCSSSRLLEILGPPGIGCSTVLDRAGQLASERGFRLLRASHDPTLAKTPLHPVRDLICQALDLPTCEVTAEELRNRTRSQGLMPEDISVLTNVFDMPRLFTHEDQSVIFRETCATVGRILEIASQEQPLCLLLDEASRYDGATQAVLSDLLPELDPSRCKLILGAAAPYLPDADQRQELFLRPLALPDVAILAGRMLGPESGADRRQLDALLEQSLGNPLHLLQALRALAEGIPLSGESLEEIVARRLARLPGPALELLQGLAIFGLGARVADLTRLGLSDEALSLPTQNLLRLRGFIHEDRADPPMLLVLHPLLAHIVHGTIEESRRPELHRLALELMEQARAPLTVRARHAFEAHLGKRALNLLERAGDLSMRLMDHTGAAFHHFPCALQVARWELHMEETQPRCLRLTHKLAQAMRLSGHLLSAELAIEQGLAQAEQDYAARGRLELEAGRLDAQRERWDEARGHMAEAIRLGLAAGVPGLLLDAYLDLAEIYVKHDNPSSAVSELTEGILMITAGDGGTRANRPKGLWRLYVELALSELRLDQRTDALRSARNALDLAAEEKTLLGQARALEVQGEIQAAQKDPGPAMVSFELAAGFYRQLCDRRSTARCLLRQADQEPASLAGLAAQALDLSDQVRWSEGQMRARMLLKS